MPQQILLSIRMFNFLDFYKDWCTKNVFILFFHILYQMTFIFTEPEEPPDEVESCGLATTSVLIKWKPPQSTHNGVIKDYKVILTKLGDQKFKKTGCTNQMEFTFHDLRRYTTYYVEVAARTSTKKDGRMSVPKKVYTSLFGKYVDSVLNKYKHLHKHDVLL